MSGAMGVFVTSLVLLACIVTISTGQGCDDVTCCPGKVCVEESTSKGPKNKIKCVHPTSCDQLNCPAGFVCSNKSKGRVECQPTCTNVLCPDSYTCREKHSRTECVRESSTNCSAGVQCPHGTTCHLLNEGRKEHAVCLGESCFTVNCFDGTQCFSGTRITSASGQDTIIVETEGGNATVSPKTLHTKATKEPINPAKGRPAVNEQDIAICLPTCEGNNVCPEGLVCHNDNHKITCQSPRSCDEVNCGPNQQCREVQCGQHKRKHPLPAQPESDSTNGIRSGQGPKDKPKPSHKHHIILQCVDTDITTEIPSSTTMPPTETTTATTETTTATTENPTKATTEIIEGGEGGK